jgi:hypothetical protein
MMQRGGHDEVALHAAACFDLADRTGISLSRDRIRSSTAICLLIPTGKKNARDLIDLAKFLSGKF